MPDVMLTSEQLDALVDAAQSRRDQTGRNDHLDVAIDVLEQAQALDLAAAGARLCRCGIRFLVADDPARCATCQAIARETGRR